jgi:hypothetical protein
MKYAEGTDSRHALETQLNLRTVTVSNGLDDRQTRSGACFATAQSSIERIEDSRPLIFRKARPNRLQPNDLLATQAMRV